MVAALVGRPGEKKQMAIYPDNIYTEPADIDIHTLRNLGPLAAMAGIWEGTRSVDINPKAAGPLRQEFVEHIELQPIDPQANGPQLFYGLRYHTHIVKQGEVETYHDQVGYWRAVQNATSFELVATRGAETNGICSNPFLEYAFKTVDYRIKITINSDGTWAYDEDTILIVRGQPEPFHHTDNNILTKIGEPTPNPLARG